MGYIDSAGGRPGQAPDRVVYLDHAATTPLLPEALSAMTEELGQLPATTSSLHNLRPPGPAPGGGGIAGADRRGVRRPAQ